MGGGIGTLTVASAAVNCSIVGGEGMDPMLLASLPGTKTPVRDQSESGMGSGLPAFARFGD